METLKLLIEKIPEATFDLISRMLPGGILVAMMRQSVPELVAAIPMQDDWVEIGVFLVFAYAAGLAVSALAHIWNVIMWCFIYEILKKGEVLKKLKCTFRELDMGEVKFDKKCPFLALAIFGRAHDFIKAKAPLERPLVVKLVAEVGLLYNLATVFLIISFYKNFPAWTFYILFVVSLLAGFIRSVRTWYRHESILWNIQHNPPAPT